MNLDMRAIDQSTMPPTEGTQSSVIQQNDLLVTNSIPVGFSHSYGDSVPITPGGHQKGSDLGMSGGKK